MLSIIFKLNRRSMWLYLVLFSLLLGSVVIMSGYLSEQDPYALEDIFGGTDAGNVRPAYVSFYTDNLSQYTSDPLAFPSVIQGYVADAYPDMFNFSYVGLSVVEGTFIVLLSPADFDGALQILMLPADTQSLVVTNGVENVTSFDLKGSGTLEIDETVHAVQLSEVLPRTWWGSHVPPFFGENSSVVLLPYDDVVLMSSDVELFGFFRLGLRSTHDLSWRYSAQVRFEDFRQDMESEGVYIYMTASNELVTYQEVLFTVIRVMGWLAVLVAVFSVHSRLVERDGKVERNFIFFTDNIFIRWFRRLLPVTVVGAVGLGVGYGLQTVLDQMSFRYSIYEPSPSLDEMSRIGLVVIGALFFLTLTNLYGRQGLFHKVQRYIVMLSTIGVVVFFELSDRLSLLLSPEAALVGGALLVFSLIVVLYILFLVQLVVIGMDMFSRRLNSARFPRVYAVSVLSKVWQGRLRSRMFSALPAVIFLLFFMTVHTVVFQASTISAVDLNGAPLTVEVSPSDVNSVVTKLEGMGLESTSVIYVQGKDLGTSGQSLSLPSFQAFLGVYSSSYSQFYAVDKLSSMARKISAGKVIIDTSTASKLEDSSYLLPFFNNSADELQILELEVLAAVKNWPMVVNDRDFAVMDYGQLESILVASKTDYNVTILVATDAKNTLSVAAELSSLPEVLSVTTGGNLDNSFKSQIPLFFLLFSFMVVFMLFLQSISGRPEDESTLASISFGHSRGRVLIMYYVTELLLVVGGITVVSRFLVGAGHYMILSDPYAIRFYGSDPDPLGLSVFIMLVTLITTLLAQLIEGWWLTRRPVKEVMKYRE